MTTLFCQWLQYVLVVGGTLLIKGGDKTAEGWAIRKGKLLLHTGKHVESNKTGIYSCWMRGGVLFQEECEM